MTKMVNSITRSMCIPSPKNKVLATTKYKGAVPNIICTSTNNLCLTECGFYDHAVRHLSWSTIIKPKFIKVAIDPQIVR